MVKKEGYKNLHIWDFPVTKIFIRLNSDYRRRFFDKVLKLLGTEENSVLFINSKAYKYGIKRKYSRGQLCVWRKGKKKDRGRVVNINVPIWVLIEYADLLSQNTKKDFLSNAERHIESYTSSGKSKSIINPKLPIKVTPEMVSLVFNFCGDGHIGRKEVVSCYYQKNKIATFAFLNKLRNIFGEFNYNKNEFKRGRLNIPRVITDIIVHIFDLYDSSTFKARIPKKIMRLPKEFLLAGLAAFMVDEGHIAKDSTIIYSKNKRLLGDIRLACLKCELICNPIREKFAYDKLDCYRFTISSKSHLKLYNDILRLKKKFPTCDLIHKMDKLKNLAIRQNPRYTFAE